MTRNSFARTLLTVVTGLSFCALTTAAQTAVAPSNIITVPMGGNAWRVAKDTSGGTITNDGIVDWTDAKVKFKTYFRVVNKGNFKLWLNLKVPAGKSVLTVSALNQTKKITVSGANTKE